MIKTCRISISFKQETKNMEAVFEEALERAGVTLDEISVKGSSYSNNTHYGNWCILPLLDNEKTAKVCEVLGTIPDLHQNIVEASDLQAFKVGDKVTLNSTSDFGFTSNKQGKV